jgi:hypothetical protein
MKSQLNKLRNGLAVLAFITCTAMPWHQVHASENPALHSDNGIPMKGATMLATLQKLGVVPSFSRPSVSDDNPYSEA